MDPGTEVGKEVDQVLGVLFSGVDPHDGAALATLRQIFGTSYVQDWADWQKWLKTHRRRDLKSELWGAILGKQKSQVHTIWKRNPYLPDTPSWTTTQGGVFRLEHLQIWFGQLTPPPPVHLSTKVIACARSAASSQGSVAPASTQNRRSRPSTTCGTCAWPVSR